MSLELRPPRQTEWRICRMLLPETFGDAAARRHVLARDGSKLVGAASYRESAEGLAGFRVHVVPPMRRRGLGSEILAGVAGDAAVEGVSEISAETGAEAFCLRNGFQRVETLTTVEAETAPLRDYFARLRRRLPIPEDARAVTPSEAPLGEVAALHAQHVARFGDVNAWRGQVAGAPQMDRSVVVMAGGRVVGALLWDFEGTTAVVRSRVVAPGLRGGWVNALLMAEAMERGCAAGARRVRFFYTETNRDTVKLARRFGAEVVSVTAKFRRAGPSVAEVFTSGVVRSVT